MEGSQLLFRWTILCRVVSRCATFDAAVIRHLQTVSSVLIFQLFLFLRHAKRKSKAPFHFHHIDCKGIHNTNETMAYYIDFIYLFIYIVSLKLHLDYKAFC